MVGKANFKISDNAYLNHAKYHFALDSGIMVAAFMDKILIGPCTYDGNGELLFTKKSIIIPSSNYVEFVKVLKKAYNSLKNNSEEPFEDLIYHHKPVHYLMGKYQLYDGEWGFIMFYKWKHAADQKFLNQLQTDPNCTPVDTSKLEDPEYQPMKRGIYSLQLPDLELLLSQLDSLLRHTITYENEEVKRNVMKFVHYATHEGKHQQFLLEKFKNYEQMRLMEKITTIQTIVQSLFEDNGQKDDIFEINCYLDILTNKTSLIFALFYHHLMD